MLKFCDVFVRIFIDFAETTREASTGYIEYRRENKLYIYNRKMSRLKCEQNLILTCLVAPIILLSSLNS